MAEEDAVVMKISSQKPARFYIKAAATFLRGTTDKPALSEMRISALGNSIPAAVQVAAAMERDELGRISQIVTSYGDATGASVACPHVSILINRAISRRRARTQTNHEAVGGHEDGIIFEGATVWKLLQTEERFEQEAGFYRKSANIEVLRDFVPDFVGFREFGRGRYLGISNLLDGFEDPAVIDLKMGTTTVPTDASPEKAAKARKKAEESTTATLGVRVVGGKYRLVKDGAWQRVGYKALEEGSKVINNEAELTECLGRFLCSPSLRAQTTAKVERLMSWFATQRDFAFYSSSLLLGYDTAELPEPKELRLSMIDFAHVEAPPADGDTSYITGLETIKRILDSLGKS